MGQIGFSIEAVDCFKLREVGSFAQLKTKALNNGASGLKVHVRFLRV